MGAHIVGTGMTRFGFAPDGTVRSLAIAALDEAMADAAVGVGDVDMVVFANAGEGVLTGQEMIRGQVVLHNHGFGGIPIMNVENACASASTALQVACMAVATGAVEVVVAVGAEKLTNPDKRRTMAVFSAAVDLDDMPTLREQIRRDLLGIGRDEGVDGPVQGCVPSGSTRPRCGSEARVTSRTTARSGGRPRQRTRRPGSDPRISTWWRCTTPRPRPSCWRTSGSACASRAVPPRCWQMARRAWGAGACHLSGEEAVAVVTILSRS